MKECGLSGSVTLRDLGPWMLRWRWGDVEVWSWTPGWEVMVFVVLSMVIRCYKLYQWHSMTTDAAPREVWEVAWLPGRKWTMASSSLMNEILEILVVRRWEKVGSQAAARLSHDMLPNFAKLQPRARCFRSSLHAARHDFRARKTSYKLDRRIINGFWHTIRHTSRFTIGINGPFFLKWCLRALCSLFLMPWLPQKINALVFSCIFLRAGVEAWGLAPSVFFEIGRSAE